MGQPDPAAHAEGPVAYLSNVTVGGDLTISGDRPVTWPVRAGKVPALADCFQQRAEFAELSLLVDAGNTVVLTGLGGLGKSQLAVSYTRSRSDRVDLQVWVSATSRESIIDAFADAARRIGHSGPYSRPEQAAHGFLSWLQSTRRSWVVVLDDLADPVDLRDLWPEGPTGRTLVTTRRTDAVLGTHGRHRVAVGVFTAAEARAYLAAKDIGVDQAGELAGDLGYLPLALAQAAAFMLDRRETCAGYRIRLHDRRRMLSELFPEQAVVDDYRATVAATWSISVEAADALTPRGVAAPLLQVLSMLDPNGFPAKIVETEPIVTLVAPAGTGSDCRDALHNLRRLSLVGLTENPEQISIHALVQRATIEGLTPQRTRVLVRCAADALLRIWPDIERDPRLAHSLRTNATALADRSDSALWLPDAHEVLRQAGRDLGQLGLQIEAITHWKAIATAAQRFLGPDHLSTLAAQAYLACWRGRAGAVTGAVDELSQVLAGYRRAVGLLHPDTLATYGDLANCLGLQRGAEEATRLLVPLLERQTDNVGADHPDTICTIYNLAHWRGESGDHSGAFDDLGTIFMGLTRASGLAEAHPTVLMVRAAQAHWLAVGGWFEQASRILELVLAQQLRARGPDHLDVLTTRAALAEGLGRSGDRGSAARQLELLLAEQQRILGPADPRLVQTRSDLKYWREGGSRTLNFWVSEDLTDEPLDARIRTPWSAEPLIGYQARANWSEVLLETIREPGHRTFPADSAWSNSVRATRPAPSKPTETSFLVTHVWDLAYRDGLLVSGRTLAGKVKVGMTLRDDAGHQARILALEFLSPRDIRTGEVTILVARTDPSPAREHAVLTETPTAGGPPFPRS